MNGPPKASPQMRTGFSLCPGSSASHEMNDQRDDGDNEQQVNQPTRNVERKKAQKPRHQ
jgi:hypothetical protein